MSNPAVMQLASLSEISGFPYRFEVEDNVGEAIHIHYKDIRLDMTIQEFNKFADSLRDIFVSLIDNPKFQIEDFDAGNLVWLAQPLIDLTDIVEEEIYLEEILVDTYDSEGNIKYLPLPNSRVLKALQGDTTENDARRQINYFKVNGCERQSNQDRLEYDLQQIRKFGYPVNNELILLREDNTIIDGQHRASCLYYLYGNIKAPVRKMYFKKRKQSEEVTYQDILSRYKEENQRLKQKQYELEQQYHTLDLALNEKDQIIIGYQQEQIKRENDIKILDCTVNEKDTIIAKYQKELEVQKQELKIDHENIANMQEKITNMQESISWKITKPIRTLSKKDDK